MSDSPQAQELAPPLVPYPPEQYARAAPRLALALGILGIVGASVGMCVGILTLENPAAFFSRNTGTPWMRGVLFAVIAGGALLALLPVGIVLLIRRLRAVDGIVKWADLLAPLCLAGIIPVLFTFRAWSTNPLPFLALLSISVLLAERLFERSFGALPPWISDAFVRLRLPTRLQRHLPTIVVVLAAIWYASYFSYYTLLNHRRFGTWGFDLGINVNWAYNALNGHVFRSTVLHGPGGGNFLAGHANFTVFMWLPLFALSRGAEMFLVYQSVMIAIAAIPLYLFARALIPRWSAALVSIAYLMYAPLHGPNFYDFHELPIALPWHFTLYWLLATKRMKWAAAVVPILWLHREDMAVGLVLLGLFLVLSGARPRFGAWLAGLSVVWFIFIKFVVMPWAGSWWFAGMYKDLMPDGKGGYGGIVQTILINPAYFLSTLLKEDKLIYFLHLFAPLAFLPARRPLLLLLAVPGFFFTLMTTGYAPTISIAFQYTTHWIPYLFAATVISLKLLSDTYGPARQRAALIAATLGVLAHTTVFGAVVQHENFVGGFIKIQFEETDADRRRFAEFKKLAAMIPQDATLAASENEVPHVAARMNMYTLKDSHGDAEYLLIRRGGTMVQSIVQDAFERNDYGLVGRAEKTFFLFKKGHRSEETASALGQLGIRKKRRERGDG